MSVVACFSAYAVKGRGGGAGTLRSLRDGDAKATSDVEAGLRILRGGIVRAKRGATAPRPEPQTDWLDRLGVSASDLEASRTATPFVPGR
jgi:hypothetical protein